MKNQSTDMTGALEKVYSCAVELLNDWSKGDFELPALAQADARSLLEACLAYESEKKKFLNECHSIIDKAREAQP